MVSKDPAKIPSPTNTSSDQRRYNIPVEVFKDSANPKQLYHSLREKPPLPDEDTLVGNNLKKYKDFQKREDSLSPTNIPLKKSVYMLIELYKKFWAYKNVRLPKRQWEELAKDINSRLAIIISVEQLREMWADGKRELLKRLEDSILDICSEKETEKRLENWSLYLSIRYYRDVLKDYEAELRKKVQGKKYDESILADKTFIDDEIDDTVFSAMSSLLEPIPLPGYMIFKSWIIMDNWLFDAMRYYMIPEFFRETDFQKVKPEEVYDSTEQLHTRIKEVSDGADWRLRIYGDPTEINEHLRCFANFPNYKELFPNSKMAPWTNKPIIFISHSGNYYIQKQDMFVILQNYFVINQENLRMNNELILIPMFLFLKSRAVGVESSCEFVKYDEKAFDEFFIALATDIAEIRKMENTPPSVNFKKGKIDEAVREWKDVLPPDFDDEGWIKKLLQTHNKIMPIASNLEVFADLHKDFILFTECVKKAFSRQLDWFQVSESKTPLLRVFKDTGYCFVMIEDIQKALGPNNFINFKKRYLCEKNEKKSFTSLHAIELNDFMETVGEDINKIELISIPIRRAKHRAVPIIRIDGGHCILAIDVFFEVLHQMMFGQKIFQNLTKDEEISKKINEAFCKIMEDNFSYQHTYFVTIADAKRLRETVTSTFSFPRGILKDVRNAKKDGGFTVQSVEKELENLGLDFEFPNITEFAEISYNKTEANKKGSLLRTCDLYDAVEKCQTSCILQKYDNLAKFVHNHRGCKKLLKCRYCDEEWEEYSIFDVTLAKTLPDFKVDMEYLDHFVRLPDGMTLMNNYSGGLFVGLTPTTKENSHKKIYMRTFPFSVVNMKDNMRVFARDALYAFRIVFEQQGMDQEELSMHLKRLHSEWSVETGNIKSNATAFGTVDLNSFKQTIMDLNVDKKRIAFVPDIDYAMSILFKCALNFSKPTPTMHCPHEARDAFRPVRSIQHIHQEFFEKIKAKVTFGLHKMPDNLTSKEVPSFEMTSKLMAKLEGFKHEFLSFDSADEMTSGFLKDSYFQKQCQRRIAVNKYYSAKFHDTFSVFQFVTDCEELKLGGFNLPPNNATKNYMKKLTIPAWKAKFFLILEMIESHFKNGDDNDSKKVITEALAFTVPLNDWTSWEELLETMWCRNNKDWPWEDALRYGVQCNPNELENHEWLSVDKETREKLVAERKSLNKAALDSERRSLETLYSLKIKKLDSSVTAVKKKKEKKATDAVKSKVEPKAAENGEKVEAPVKPPVERVPKGPVDTVDRAVSPMPFVCNKCPENAVALVKVNAELAEEQQKLRPLEEKAENGENEIEEIKKRTEAERERQKELEKELVEKDKMIKNLEKKQPNLTRELKELENLKREVRKRETDVQDQKNQVDKEKEKLSNAEAEWKNQKNLLKKELNSKKEEAKVLSAQIEIARAQIHPFEDTGYDAILDRQLQILAAIHEKRKEKHRLLEIKRNLENENEEKERTYNLLLDQLQGASLNDAPSTSPKEKGESLLGPYTSPYTPQGSSMSASLSSANSNLLSEMLGRKNEILNSKTYENASSGVKQLMVACVDEASIATVNYEWEFYERQYQAYMSVLEENILKLQNNNGAPIKALPPFPRFSEMFLNHYKLVFNEPLLIRSF